MNCNWSEEELWSGIDRQAAEVEEHLATCTTCQGRAAQFRAGISAVTNASTPLSPPLPDRIGSYRIQRRLGEGGMGIVYEGEQETPKRLVAVKVVRGGQYVDEYRVKLFQREVQTLARLKHPSIAAIYEAGRTDDGQHFFAMELVTGLRLDEYLRKRRVPRNARLQLFRKICDAINYAHQRGVIHRDLKPTNILVDPEGNPKILDFGLARITDPDVALTASGTEMGKVMGTLRYMSPEEARGTPDEIDVRSDVYSLGVVFYELLTNDLPYTVSRAVLHEAVRVICEEQPRRPSSIDRSLRGDLETIALKALAKERGRRYQSAAAFAEDIERYMTDQPILARRASTLYQLRKFMMRHKLVVAFVVALMSVMASATVWVDRMETELRKSTQMTADLQDLRVAANAERMAEEFRDLRNHPKAEQWYRKALVTFERLDRHERAGGAMLELASVLVEQDNPDDYEEAEEKLLDALQIFEAEEPAWLDRQREALKVLGVLYSPDRWDAPAALAEVEAALRGLPDSMPATPVADSDVAP